MKAQMEKGSDQKFERLFRPYRITDIEAKDQEIESLRDLNSHLMAECKRLNLQIDIYRASLNRTKKK